MTREDVYVSVTGASGAHPELDRHAAEVGRLLAERSCVLVCGGLGGVMEAASRAAYEVGGQVLGIVPTEDRTSANPYCTLVAATGMGQARNLAVAASGDAMIAIGTGWGTLSEIGLARKLGRPVVTISGRPLDGVHAANGAQEAVALVLDLVGSAGGSTALP